MTPKPLAIAAALCALLVLPQPASADNCISSIWSTRQSRADGPQGIQSLQTIDYDSDGKLDLVGLIDTTGSSGSGVLNSWHGLGDGTFAPPVNLGVSDVQHVEVVDLNNDGHADLVMTTTSQIVVRLGNGSSFDAPITQNLDYIAIHFVTVHVNGGTFADLIAMSVGSNLIVVYHGDGLGHFTETRRFNTASLPWTLAAADFDGDGRTDIAYGVRSPSGSAGSVDVAFQKADGSFEVPLVMPAPDYPTDLAVGDLNGDGRPDLVSVIYNATFANDPAVLVFRNLGSRNFSRSDLFTSLSQTVGNMSAVRLADVNGDNHLDIVTGAENGGYVLTYPGIGDGTFRSPTYYFNPDAYLVGSIVLGNFDGDLVPDLAIAAYQRFVTAGSSCGTQAYLFSVSPTITLGQSAPLRALVSGIAQSTPLPRGTVTFREGATTLGSADVDATGVASLDVGGFPLGGHTVTADFSGNSESPAATSQSIVQNVITGASTTTFVFPQAQSVFGTPYTFIVQIHNQFGQQVGACFLLKVDGVDTHPCSATVTLSLSAGQHTLTATYQGSNGIPPSTSGPQVITTAKATPGLTNSGGALTVRAGETHTLQFFITTPSGTVATGNVSLLNGNTLLGNGNVSANAATVPATLPRGEYDVVAVYSGDGNFNGATINLRLDVLPNVPLAIHARSLANAISIRAVLPANTTSAALYRRVNGSGNTWQLVNGWTTQSEFDSSALTRGVLYDYRLDATVSGNIQTSNIDSALLFTDDPIVSGATGVKRIHLDELRLLINALRASGGLAPFNFDGTYADLLVRASHLALLRNALFEARQTLGMPVPSFTDAATAGTLIKAVHLTELRQQSQ